MESTESFEHELKDVRRNIRTQLRVTEEASTSYNNRGFEWCI